MQSQLVCSGCRSILLYSRSDVNVYCALCSTTTSVRSPVMEMAQLFCGGCRTLLMCTREATSVRCSCCHTVNLAPATNQFFHISCGICRTLLMYPSSVKCALCQYVTNATSHPPRTPIPPQRPESSPTSSTSTQTVVVENPMSFDESGKLVTNVTTEKRIMKEQRTVKFHSY